MAIKKVTSVKFWRELGKDVRDLYKDYIFEKGHSVYDGDWWGGRYSPEYEKAKSTGNLPRQATAYKDQVTAVLTTQTQSDFEGFLEPRNTGVKLGYPSMGDRVRRLRKRKPKDGALTTKDRPIPKHLSKYIAKEYHKFIKKNSKNTTRIHRGKK